jgi:hypothetical protein
LARKSGLKYFQRWSIGNDEECKLVSDFMPCT